ncbi:MAG: serine hydrolase, partial [Rhodospirillales bacterium]|nr:serine hydrolase [Rhodospirillales bacterium]
MTDRTAHPVAVLPKGEEFLLLSPTDQPHAYRNVDRMFATRPIRRGATQFEIPRGSEIAPRYVTDGVERSVDDYIRRTNIAGLLVIQDGAIRLERYALGLTPQDRWSTMSTVKSMTSTLIGAAIQDGAIGSVDDPVCRHLPILRGSAYEGTTVRHLLTMSSGVRWSEDYTDRNSDVNRYSKSLGDKVPGGVLALMRGLPAEVPPGSRFLYNTGDTYLLGCLLSAATGTTIAAYMSEKIWSRFGMEADGFYTLESEDGQEIGGSRAGVTLRDFGRFGLFLLADGVVDGVRVLPDGWVQQAATPRFTLDPAANSWGATGYGYSWWLDPDGAMVAVGFAGQSLYVNRRTRSVIVTLSCWPQPPYDAAYGVDRKAERLAF